MTIKMTVTVTVVMTLLTTMTVTMLMAVLTTVMMTARWLFQLVKDEFPNRESAKQRREKLQQEVTSLVQVPPATPIEKYIKVGPVAAVLSTVCPLSVCLSVG